MPPENQTPQAEFQNQEVNAPKNKTPLIIGIVILAVVALIVGGYFVFSGFGEREETSTEKVVEKQETIVYSFTGTGQFHRISTDPHGKNFAFVRYEGEKQFVVLNGEEHNRYDSIEYLSLDEQGVSYIARQGDQEFIVLNREELERHDWVERFTTDTTKIESPTQKNILFSPDGKKFVYTAQEISETASDFYVSYRTFLIFSDGKKIELSKTFHPSTINASFSPDSKRFAYVGWEGDRHGGRPFVVVDGEREDIDGWQIGEEGIIFSPDSQSYVYRVKGAGGSYFVLNGVKQSLYEKVSMAYFSSQNDFAYSAAIGNEEFVVINGEEQERYDKTSTRLIFSPDGNRFAYSAGRGEEKFVIVDGEELKSFSSVGNVIFSPDSKSFAYMARWDEKSYFILNKRGSNREEGPYGSLPYGSIREINFSLDSNRYAYSTEETPSERFFVIDGERQEHGFSVRDFSFSPDGKNYAYVITLRSPEWERREWWDTTREVVILNGEKMGWYDDVTRPVFSDDGSKLKYFAVNIDREIDEAKIIAVTVSL